MKSIKRMLALLLVTAMIVSCFVACSDSASGSTADVSAVDSGGAATTDNSAEEPAHIVWALPDYYGATGIKEVEERVNEITIPAINVEVEILYLNFGDFRTQMNLMLTGEDQVDIVYCWADTFVNYTNAEMIQPLDDLLDEYGQGIKDALNDNYWRALSVDGEVYAVGSITEKAVGTSICMDKELVDKYSIDVESINSIEDLTAVFKTIKDNEPDISPLVPYVVSGAAVGMNSADFIDGDSYACLLNGGQTTEVSSWIESEEFAQLCALAHEWNEAGYILPDAETNQFSGETLVANGTGFAFFCSSKPGIASEESNKVGKEMVVAELNEPFGNTSKYRVCSYAIPYNSADPVAAMKFLNLLYTDADLANTMAWGVEGTHWVWDENGQMTYPEGLDASTSNYSVNGDWMFGNMSIMGTWDTFDPDYHEQMIEFNESSEPSKALGFVADTSMLANEKAALKNVYEKYHVSLLSSTIDPETELPKYIQELKAAGLDTWIEEVSSQFSDWCAANGVS